MKKNCPTQKPLKLLRRVFIITTMLLLKHTTTESFAILSSLQDLFAEDEKSEINFAVIEDTIDGDVAWVRYSTSFEEKPSVFKLIKENGRWKVTERKPREKMPF